ncbi:hypothetical protein CYR75_10785 [Paracoccus jeotgali]|uniref:Mitochondrial inner membrane protein n=1 Tax=Paracoccus jeotgali TaxID=2065379 RepID=A0A2K9MGC3_9RHOB|nr:hypothetical protein CYR75_10785 [Paracoccus jeotgali]
MPEVAKPSKSAAAGAKPVSGAADRPASSDSVTKPGKPSDTSGSTTRSDPPAAPRADRADRRSSFGPLVLGGVVAAGLGAAAAVWVLPAASPYLPSSWRPADTAIDPVTLTSQVTEAARQTVQAELPTLRDQAAQAGAEAGENAARQALETAVPAEQAAAQPAGLTEAEVQSIVTAQLQAALAERAPEAAAPETAASETASSETASTDAPATESAETASADTAPAQSEQPAGPDLAAQIEDLEARLDQQAERIAALDSRPTLDPQAVEQVRGVAADAERIRSEIETAAAEARERLDSVKAEAEKASDRAQAVASLALLGAVLNGGEGSPTEAVAQLQEAGVTVPEPLAQGDLPTLDQLQMGYDAAARAALTASLKAESPRRGPVGAIGNFLRVQTGARSVEPREGDDPDAILSRAGALVGQGQVQAALDELAALPEPGQKAMADWTAQAKAWLAAEKALQDVSQSLN